MHSDLAKMLAKAKKETRKIAKRLFDYQKQIPKRIDKRVTL